MKNRLICLVAAAGLAPLGASDVPPSFEAAGFKFSGVLSLRYEWTQNPRPIIEDQSTSGVYSAAPSSVGSASGDCKSLTREKLILVADKQLTGSTRVHINYVTEHVSARTSDGTPDLKEAYGATRFGDFEVGVGRFIPDIGIQTLGPAGKNDGVMIAYNSGALSGRDYVTRWGNQSTAQSAWKASHATYLAADLKYRPFKSLVLDVAVLKDLTSPDDVSKYNSYSLGAIYTYAINGTRWLELSGEFAHNSALGAKKMSSLASSNAMVGGWNGTEKSPSAWWAKAKLLGANPMVPGSFGIGVEYRYADVGMDTLALSNNNAWDAPFNWATPGTMGYADNNKGWEFSAEATVSRQVLVRASYGLQKPAEGTALKSLATKALSGAYDAHQNYFICAVAYRF